MAKQGYKKYMKKNVKKENSLLKIFIISFFGMLLIFTFLIKSFSPTVDTSIGDYQKENEIEIPEEPKNNIDNRLAIIQDEDQGKSFTELMSKAEDAEKNIVPLTKSTQEVAVDSEIKEETPATAKDIVYKVFIGSYTSAEQAKVAKEIIQESGSSLNPIVKCIGTNNYTLQVGIFKNKQSAESLLYTVQQANLPGRVIQDY